MHMFHDALVSFAERRVISMNEKAYKTMGLTGAANIAIGIVMMVVGVAAGVVAVIGGARLLKNREGLMF